MGVLQNMPSSVSVTEPSGFIQSDLDRMTPRQRSLLECGVPFSVVASPSKLRASISLKKFSLSREFIYAYN